MNIPIEVDCHELENVDTTPSAQFEVDLAYVESTPQPIRGVALKMICLMARTAEFGRN